MSEATSLPVYIQISEMLMREIIAGRLSDGERLLPERDLAKSLNISVGTLRKALKDLEQKGALFRRHGSGNYIKFNTKQNFFIFLLPIYQTKNIHTSYSTN